MSTGQSVYASRHIKKKRRTQAELLSLDDALITIVSQVQPATVRQVFYQAVVHGLAPKDERGYNLVQRRLLTLRREGRIPYHHIVDNLRMSYHRTRYRDREAFTREVASLYRRDYWARNPVQVEVWIEKDALASTLIPIVVDEWGLSLHVARGFSSASYLHSAGEDIRHDGRATFVYILSDFDPAGIVLAEKIAEGLQEFSGDVSVTVERIALTEEQIARYDLPTHGLKATDSRAKGFRSRYGNHAVELDALPPNVLRKLVSDAIGRHADPEEIGRLKEIEELERESFVNLWGKA